VPTADELLSADAVLGLIDCLGVAAPGTEPTVLRGAVAELSGQALAERARAVRDALLTDLPGGFAPFAEVVDRALADRAFTGWMIWPLSEAVAVLAVRAEPGSPPGGEFEAGLALLARLTGRLTGEFAIRTFLDADLGRTLAVVRKWTAHPDEHVRRLASEGTRPRLPWARRVRAIMERPDAALGLLDALYRDESDYVRRSVANHLNDVSRIDAALATATARRWLARPDGHTAAVVRHALRSLVKAGDPDALALLGFAPPAGIVLSGFALTGSTVELGGGLGFEFSVANHGAEPARLAIDYVIHHRKANGTLAPKVFKLTTRTLLPGAAATIERTHSFRPISTRRYYPGAHALEIQVNGARLGRHEFLLASP
jgi:3-methyladenine DNA glycosylase AlkC